MKLDELFGSLCTFELHLGDGESRRKPGLALTSVKEELIEEHKVSQNNDSLVESMVLLRKLLQNSKVSYTNILGVNAAAVKPTQQFSKEYPVLPHQDYIEGKTMNEEKRTMVRQNLRRIIKESDVMNVKGLDTFKPNVQPISNVKRRVL